jgi:hypothetical protein
MGDHLGPALALPDPLELFGQRAGRIGVRTVSEHDVDQHHGGGGVRECAL